MTWGCGGNVTRGPFCGLPIRIANILSFGNLRTRAQVVKAYKDRRLPNMHKGFGPKTNRVVLQWLEASK